MCHSENPDKTNEIKTMLLSQLIPSVPHTRTPHILTSSPKPAPSWYKPNRASAEPKASYFSQPAKACENPFEANMIPGLPVYLILLH